MRRKPAVRMKRSPHRRSASRTRSSILDKVKASVQERQRPRGALFANGKAQIISAFDHIRHGMRRFVIVMELLLVLVLTVALVAYWQKLRDDQSYHISSIQILGHQPAPVESALREKLSSYQSKGLFTADINELQVNLLTIPWVRAVQITRSWPDALIVDVDTWEPVARWGENQWLDNTGQLFSLDTVLSPTVHLPQLNGPDEDAVQVYKMHQQIQKVFNQYGLKMAGLTKVPSGSWEITMQSGMEVRLKADEVFEGLRGFVKIYDQIAAQESLVDYVDMRYPDGGAIRWEPAAVAAANDVGETTTIQ